jgi:cyclopropane-fatty-acyl-phospholipid synthase
MRSLVESTLARFGERVPTPFAVTFPDGGQFANQDGEPEFRIAFRNNRALLRVAHSVTSASWNRISTATWTWKGSLALALAAGCWAGSIHVTPLVRLRNLWHEWRYSNADWAQATRERALPLRSRPRFLPLWLDEALMMYTCGYWREGTRTVEEAQRNKVEHVCRKLASRPAKR